MHECLEPEVGLQSATPKRRQVTPREYRATFAARVRQARTTARYPIDEMAPLLGITRDTYNKYEGRGALLVPHNQSALLPRVPYVS